MPIFASSESAGYQSIDPAGGCNFWGVEWVWWDGRVAAAETALSKACGLLDLFLNAGSPLK